MIKKKLSILLLLSLAVLFIGSFSTTYAKNLSETEIRNFMLNYLDAFYSTSDTRYTLYRERILNADLSGWKNGISGKQGLYLLQAYKADNGQLNFYYFCWRNTNNNYAYLTEQNGQDYINTRDLSITYRNRFNVADNIFNYDQAGITINKSNREWDYFDGNIYNYDKNEIEIEAYSYIPNYLNDTVFTNNYNPTQDDYFAFLLNSSLQTMTINGDEVPYYDLQTNQAESFTLGQLGLAENFDYAELYSYRYKNGEWKHVGTTTLYNIGETTDNLILVTINGNMVNSNTLYNLTMYSDPDSDFANISQPFYMANRNTVITNGALNTDETFSGDYYNNYNNDTNTDNIINNLNNNDNIDDTISNYLSGDYQSLANDFGYTELENPFTTFLLNIFEGFFNTLRDRGPVYLDFNHHGTTNWFIDTDEFYMPEGPIKTLVKTCLVFLYLFSLYKYFHYIIHCLETARTDNLVAILGHDEFYSNDTLFM